MAAGVIGTTNRDFGDVLMVAAITFTGMTGLWLLPAAVSPRVLRGLPKRGESKAGPS
jgi:hypothetical protein